MGQKKPVFFRTLKSRKKFFFLDNLFPEKSFPKKNFIRKKKQFFFPNKSFFLKTFFWKLVSEKKTFFRLFKVRKKTGFFQPISRKNPSFFWFRKRGLKGTLQYDLAGLRPEPNLAVATAEKALGTNGSSKARDKQTASRRLVQPAGEDGRHYMAYVCTQCAATGTKGTGHSILEWAGHSIP